jgi:hypothetical protein
LPAGHIRQAVALNSRNSSVSASSVWLPKGQSTQRPDASISAALPAPHPMQSFTESCEDASANFLRRRARHGRKSKRGKSGKNAVGGRTLSECKGAGRGAQERT